MKVAVLGAGAWGTALAIGLASQHGVHLWARSAAHAEALVRSRENARYLPGRPIPPSVQISADLHAIGDCDALVCAVPMVGLREVLAQFASRHFAVPVVLACKGFERGTGLLPHQVAAELLPGSDICVLSGPSFAQEVAGGLPAAVVLAAADASVAAAVARALHSTRLRVYSNTDLTGVAVAGATKNVMAIAAGICDGLGLGLNARAALVTRGIAEIARLGLKLGGRMETFMGLAGLGDLVLTCTGHLSRNRTVGLKLAQGEAIDAILATLGHVAEGVDTAYEVAALADRLAVDMPITRAVCGVLRAEQMPADAVALLLERDPRTDF